MNRPNLYHITPSLIFAIYDVSESNSIRVFFGLLFAKLISQFVLDVSFQLFVPEKGILNDFWIDVAEYKARQSSCPAV